MIKRASADHERITDCRGSRRQAEDSVQDTMRLASYRKICQLSSWAIAGSSAGGILGRHWKHVCIRGPMHSRESPSHNHSSGSSAIVAEQRHRERGQGWRLHMAGIPATLGGALHHLDGPAQLGLDPLDDLAAIAYPPQMARARTAVLDRSQHQP
jgi:hypothetical protein